MIKKIFRGVGIFLLLAVFYFFLLLNGGLQTAAVQTADETLLPRIDGISSDNLQDLAAAFEAQIPYVSADGVGSVETMQNGARKVTWHDAKGLTVTAVRPASQAHLLRYEGLSMDTSCRWTILDYAAAVAHDSSSVCVYYAADNAAYALYLPQGDVQSLEGLLEQLSFINP